MKKLLLLSALLIFACSSDDSSDTNNNNFEPIIGVWDLYYQEHFSDMSNSWVDTTTDGIINLTTTFYENGEFLYEEIHNDIHTLTGVWENLGNNIYRIETNMLYENGVLVSEDVNFTDIRILFYCDNNIMRYDWGYEYPDSSPQDYFSKDSYNPQDCNEAPYNAN